ncbi:MAG: tetratricopeptide repeat protein [Saprospiraceae bacterium]|nr:tetratricopeptide repeat protein [Saprospiraceae bacterium]
MLNLIVYLEPFFLVSLIFHEEIIPKRKNTCMLRWILTLRKIHLTIMQVLIWPCWKNWLEDPIALRCFSSHPKRMFGSLMLKCLSAPNTNSFMAVFCSAKDKTGSEKFTELTNRFPKDYRGWYGLALYHAQQGNRTAALDQLEKALDLYYPIPQPILEEPHFKNSGTRSASSHSKKHFNLAL